MSEDMVAIHEVPVRKQHYHGDIVRVLFVGAAVLIFLTRFIGTALPFTTFAQMLLILSLVIAAGITNPVTKWIHFVNILLATAGTLTFASLSFSRIETGRELMSSEGMIAVIAIVFITALYFATRTYRGLSVPHSEL